jgi:flagellar basal-body rod protein FlgG
MNPALWVAKTGLDAQQTNMAVFQDLMYQNVTQVGAATSQNTQAASGLELGTGVDLVATEKVYTQGNLNQTGNSLDLAINGNGFFQVLMPDGSLAYTRDGSFQLSATGQLVTASGYTVQPAITIPSAAQSVTIAADGTVQVLLAGSSTPSTVGTVQLANFVNPSGLQANGQNLLVESASSGNAQTGGPGINGMGSLQQGYTESSNVDVVEEMVNMIETQRAYEMNTKAIETNDQMLSYLDTNL